jgi:hypothetical protein
VRPADRLGSGPAGGTTSLLKRALRAPAMSIASQGVGVLQLGLLLLRAGANEATDAFYYLFNLGMLSITGIVVGVVYPSLLNQERLSRSDLRRLRNLVPVLCLLVVAGGAGWLTANDRLGPGLYLLAVLSGANAVVQARLWFRAVAAEAGGQALWIAGVALPANLTAVAALAPPWPAPNLAVTAMSGGLLLGNLVLLVVMRRRRVGDAVLVHGAATTGSRRGSAWFLGTAAAAFLSQTVLQSLAVLLPAAGLTILNLASKVVGSISAAFVNATMPLLVHERTDSPAPARRFLRIVVLVEALGGALLVLGTHLVRPDATLAAVVVAVWMVGSGSAAVAQRMGFRFLSARDVAQRQIASVVVVVPLALLSSWGAGFTLTVLLCAYAAIDAITAALLLWPLKDRRMGAVLVACTVALGALWIVGMAGR